ncbi:hypothetical protein [Maribacter sp. HTCC2170]|uniref:hypothetical protein n=1 Tax=Maribacter sp. (strain HTCC2170 / KCCM 42371) TaxID=313603 RepID=UPI00006BD37F|nr:hypothetical protein [Maribacter sp. HTCC2170]EAR02654.1 hypothetical protein FB2170_05185 [Maribacter sp. HTCC2170]
MKKMSRHFLFLLAFLSFFSSCNSKKKTKSDLEIEFTKDTLDVGYTYWWPESGAFIGQCGDELSLVFSGTITDILEPTDEAGPLYTSQKGYVLIDRVFKAKDLGQQSYKSQQFFVSDCFNGLNLKVDDHLLVFCYDYENALSIPGNKSILRIESLDDPLIDSIKKYIDADQNPKNIEKDVKLWEKHGLNEDLMRILDCSQTVDP